MARLARREGAQWAASQRRGLAGGGLPSRGLGVGALPKTSSAVRGLPPLRRPVPLRTPPPGTVAIGATPSPLVALEEPAVTRRALGSLPQARAGSHEGGQALTDQKGIGQDATCAACQCDWSLSDALAVQAVAMGRVPARITRTGRGREPGKPPNGGSCLS